MELRQKKAFSVREVSSGGLLDGTLKRRSGGGALFGVAVALMVVSGPSLAAPPSPGPLVFAGSGGNLAITRLLAEVFRRNHPEIAIEIPPSLGSSGGIQAIAEGAVTLGLSARPLRQQEKDLGLTSIPYARTAVVIAVHPTVADDEITFADLIDIYKGTKTRWKDGREIIVLTREPGESVIIVLEREVPGFKEVFAESHRARRWMTLFKDQEMYQALSSKPYAIGLSDMGAIMAERLPIKALKVNGVSPTPDDVLSRRYPLAKTLAFVYRETKLPAEARAYIDFVRSPAGEQILRANGYVPGE